MRSNKFEHECLDLILLVNSTNIQQENDQYFNCPIQQPHNKFKLSLTTPPPPPPSPKLSTLNINNNIKKELFQLEIKLNNSNNNNNNNTSNSQDLEDIDNDINDTTTNSFNVKKKINKKFNKKDGINYFKRKQDIKKFINLNSIIVSTTTPNQ